MRINMKTGGTLEFSEGEGRARVSLSASYAGEDLVVQIYNKNAHIGAVAVAEFDRNEQRASVSVITQLGHKEDVVARDMAHLICKMMRKAVCVIAGIHLDNITEAE